MDAIEIPKDQYDFSLEIPGLEFQRNLVSQIKESDEWFSSKVYSSPGPLISDYVTHGPEFEYSTLGIHVGQDDRLTFLGTGDEIITGYFVDCREGSPSLHKMVSCRFHASEYRRLIIPRGVAHTFDGLPGVVTRDEPIWYSGEANPHWNVNNDLISVLRSATEFPVIPTNEMKLPEAVHVYMSRLSQSVLDQPKAYSTRFNLNINGEDQYVMFQETTWDNEGRSTQSIIDAVHGAYVSARRSKYAITGKASWTLVPNTGAGVSDVLFLRAGLDSITRERDLFLHRRTRKLYTFLTAEGSALELEALDLRPNSSTFMKGCTAKTICDPRVSFVIEPGVAYRFLAETNVWVRSENEVFVAEDEPRTDLPPFGGDLEIIRNRDNIAAQPPLPELRCPEQVVRQMAHFEVQMFDISQKELNYG